MDVEWDTTTSGSAGMLHQLADLGEASALIAVAIALFGLWLSLRESQKRNRDNDFLKWQKLAVYEAIKGGAVTFKEIKYQYIIGAQQYEELPINKKEISDSAIKLALLSLIEQRLISYTAEGTYAINVVSLSEAAQRALLFEEMIKRRGHQKIISNLLDLLETQSGRFTIEQAYRHLKLEESEYTFAEFNIMVREYAARGFIVIARDDKIWLRTRLPQQSKMSQASAEQPRKALDDDR